MILTLTFRATISLGQLTSSAEPGGFALLAGDASVDSWFREIHFPRDWRVYLAIGFDFRLLVLGRSEPEFAVTLLPGHFTMKKE